MLNSTELKLTFYPPNSRWYHEAICVSAYLVNINVLYGNQSRVLMPLCVTPRRSMIANGDRALACVKMSQCSQLVYLVHMDVL